VHTDTVRAQDRLVQQIRADIADWQPKAAKEPNVVATAQRFHDGDGRMNKGMAGLEYFRLDTDAVAWRHVADWTPKPGQWHLGTMEAFKAAVILDAERYLDAWRKEL